MEYRIKDFHQNITDQELLSDLKMIACRTGQNSVTSKQYDDTGKFNSTTFCKRFGSWNKSLKIAGLGSTLYINIPEKKLLENMETVWINLGRQPSRREMRQPLSKYSTSPYLRTFGTWRKSLYAFVEFINSTRSEAQETPINESPSAPESVFKHKTNRIPSERLKVRVLMRDGNKCRLCGTTVTGENIHFDHILPWSKGGETTLENLQILCEHHNLVKGNL